MFPGVDTPVFHLLAVVKSATGMGVGIAVAFDTARKEANTMLFYHIHKERHSQPGLPLRSWAENSMCR